MSIARYRPRRLLEADDYEVGFGKPPRHSQFLPGQSGNPRGRPKGVRSFATEVQALLRAPVNVVRDGKAQQVSTQEGALWRLREKVLVGDLRALSLFLELARTYSKEDGGTKATTLSAAEKTAFNVLVARIRSGAIEPPDIEVADDDLPLQMNTED
jgi:hypothetical protein